MNLTIREAFSDIDTATIFDLLKGMHAEIEASPLNRVKAIEGISDCIQNGGVWMVWDGDECVASLGLYPFDQWFSDEKIIGNLWFYVRPTYRHSEAAELLMRQARDLAKAARMKVLLDLPFPRMRRHSASVIVAERLGFSVDAGILEMGHVLQH